MMRLADLTERLATRNGAKSAQDAVKEMIDDCVIVSRVIINKYSSVSKNPSHLPTRTERYRELEALATELVSVQKKLKELSPTLHNAISVSYLTARHRAGNPVDFSKSRLTSLRPDQQTFDVDLTIGQLLMALHDDVKEVGSKVKAGMDKKRQTGSADKIATEMIDAVWRAVRIADGRDAKPPPTILVVELCRTLFTAHGYNKTPNESTVRSRLSHL